MNVFLRINVVILVITALTSCGNSDSGNPVKTLLPGYFIDSFVTGLRYETDSQIGTTDADGKFSYVDGEFVSFYVGNIFIGQAKAKSVMTPLDLVPNAIDETNPQVTNILRFVQTLDSNGDPNDGIDILAAARDTSLSATINFEQDITSFETDQALIDYLASLDQITGNTTTLVSAAAAQNHFYSSVMSIYSRNYAGPFDGDLSGSWMFIVNNGVITGTVTINDVATLVSGQMKIDGSAEISVYNSTMVFSAAFNKFGLVSGTWNDTSNNTRGNFVNYMSHGEITEVFGPISPYGSLKLIGNDVVNFETDTFSPRWLQYQSPNEPSWDIQIDNSSYWISVVVNSDATVGAVYFEKANPSSNVSYFYSLICVTGSASADCAELANNISVDLLSQQITFNNLVLNNDSFGVSTDTLTLQGTLTYLDQLVFN